jgi:hypothetical protein
MIRIFSDHVKKKALEVEVLTIRKEERTIWKRDCIVSVGTCRSSSGGKYITIVYLYKDELHHRYDFATCDCKGYMFKDTCGHIAAVFDIAIRERV